MIIGGVLCGVVPRLETEIRKKWSPKDEGLENMGAEQTVLGTPQTRHRSRAIRSILSITTNTKSL
jgi:hypothetical protein